MTAKNAPQHDALFYLEGPDHDGRVWIGSTDVPGWHHDLGRPDKVAEVLLEWLGSRPIDFGEVI